MTFKILKTFILELKGFWGPWPASQDAYAIKGSNVFQLMSWIEGWQNKSQFKSESDFVSCGCNFLHASSPQPPSPIVSNEASPTSLVILLSLWCQMFTFSSYTHCSSSSLDKLINLFFMWVLNVHLHGKLLVPILFLSWKRYRNK